MRFTHTDKNTTSIFQRTYRLDLFVTTYTNVVRYSVQLLGTLLLPLHYVCGLSLSIVYGITENRLTE